MSNLIWQGKSEADVLFAMSRSISKKLSEPEA
jgi:hypothetical protein